MMSEYQLGRVDALSEVLSMAQILASRKNASPGIRSAWGMVISNLDLRLKQEMAECSSPGGIDGAPFGADQDQDGVSNYDVSNVEPLPSEEEEAVLEFLGKTARSLRSSSEAVHKRKCAIRAGVREWTEIACDWDQHDWDEVREWCRTCGMTRSDLLRGNCHE